MPRSGIPPATKAYSSIGRDEVAYDSEEGKMNRVAWQVGCCLSHRKVNPRRDALLILDFLPSHGQHSVELQPRKAHFLHMPSYARYHYSTWLCVDKSAHACCSRGFLHILASRRTMVG